MNFKPYYQRTIAAHPHGLKLVVGGTGLGKTHGVVETLAELDGTRKAVYIANRVKLLRDLEKTPDEKLPSTRSVQSQRLSRRVKHDVETAVVQCFDAHPATVFVIEALDVSGMRFKSKRMNRYLKASQIGHIQAHMYWTAAKRGVPLVAVPAAYSSQECPDCHYADRANRPTQQTFCWVRCGHAGHADVVAAGNLQKRLTDTELRQCRNKEAIKKLLDKRHTDWLSQQPPR